MQFRDRIVAGLQDRAALSRAGADDASPSGFAFGLNDLTPRADSNPTAIQFSGQCPLGGVGGMGETGVR